MPVSGQTLLRLYCDVSANYSHVHLCNVCYYALLQVVKERAYSLTWHPSPHKLVAVAGDKIGNIGLWCVDAAQDSDFATAAADDATVEDSDTELDEAALAANSTVLKTSRSSRGSGTTSMRSSKGGADGVYLYKPHMGSVSRLQFAPG
jgi:hypothetical protein